ncbi:hypothetical protein Lal_00038142 [Lupinus albus]|uniref:Putative sinapine esterase n=1 Tax=Lupinus albus TaxID=3870 RepID=A0A6A5N219_LUPAL|nr:putative sinapine esterase [Lupinus albus]KAF1877833.1 hypothetical protein Lal_00038142 [Lupinus albus]
MMMNSYKILFCPFYCFLVLLLSGQTGMQAEARHLNHHLLTKLFAFGDSYADTGNTRKGEGGSWIEPYGITFPGKPAGRWSDGRVLTDYIAKYLRLKSPIPYRLRKKMASHIKYGMNFAFGGTGVFNTSSSYPNMTIQIDFLEQLIKQKVYTASDLSNSVTLVAVSGNDYNFYLATNGSIQDFPSFITSVVNQITTNLIRIQKLGVKKIIVDGLQPLGCLPQTTVSSSFQQCNSTFNNLVLFHNDLLNQSVTKLNQENNNSIQILDLYDSFMSVLNDSLTHNIQNSLKPCCFGVSSDYNCGSVVSNEKKYELCDKPKSAFFWDGFHPTQAGWHAVYSKLKATNVLHRLLWAEGFV